MRAEYVRSSGTGTDIPDDIMLSVLVRALPKAIQQHVQLQLNETSTYDQVRAMVVSYERATTSWSPGKIHSELGILPQSQNQSFNQSSNNTHSRRVATVYLVGKTLLAESGLDSCPVGLVFLPGAS